MIRRPPRSTPKPSSAASDVYKRQRLERKMDTILLRRKLHHRSGSPSTNICPSKGTQQYPRYQPGTRGTSRTPRATWWDSGTQHLAAAATGPNPGQGNTTGGSSTTGGRLDYLLQLAKGVPRSQIAARSTRSCPSIKQSDSGTVSIVVPDRVTAVPLSEIELAGRPRIVTIKARNSG